MYCVKCGVKLADSEKKCPLCGTVVYNPTLEMPNGRPTYPPEERQIEKVSPSGALFIITMLFLIPMLLSIICNLEINGKLSWSLYAVGGIVLAYIIVALPMWFTKPNPVIFVPCDLVAIGAYVLLICLLTGGDWFLSFAFPLVGGILIIVESVVVLMRYVHRGYLYIFGGAFISIGAFMPLVEFLAGITFGAHTAFKWSLYPLIACAVIGLMLILIAICKPLRRSLEKKFFI